MAVAEALNIANRGVVERDVAVVRFDGVDGGAEGVARYRCFGGWRHRPATRTFTATRGRRDRDATVPADATVGGVTTSKSMGEITVAGTVVPR